MIRKRENRDGVISLREPVFHRPIPSSCIFGPMDVSLIIALSFSIFIPVAIGMIRFKKINPIYYPFLVLLCLGAINEVISYFLIKAHHSNAVNNNLFLLAESLLILYQFKQWRLFTGSLRVYYVFSGLVAAFWLTESFIIGSIHIFNSYFIIANSLLVVLLSITMISRLMAKRRKILWRDPVFILCAGFIFFFTYAIIVEAFYIYGLAASNLFQRYVFRILAFVNLFTNLLYALAVLWMPRRQEYIHSF
ncbi:MAG TPA: hypothetical protein VGN63_05615 [Flavisolibacter sp.]|jgi:hypothetical protein|nr:hypothetical protein [Flavisolibacter sp.]